MNPLVKVFIDALTPQARRRLERDPDMTLLIERCITGGWMPETLADLVGFRIGWAEPINARDVMIFRLRKAAGDDLEGADA